MRAALLCPGPSLARLPAVPACDFSVGVNRAALRFPLSVWVALDQVAVTPSGPGGIRHWQHQVLGNPLLVTCAESHASLIRHRYPWRGEVVTVEQFRDWLPHPRHSAWTLYSATVALCYAAWRGAKVIDVYGADMMGTTDYDGQTAGSNRTDQRWASERHIWDWLVGALAERGCEVIRHELP